MKHKKELCLCVLLAKIFVLFGLLVFDFSKSSFLSFECGFLSFSLVLFVSYLNYLKLINKNIKKNLNKALIFQKKFNSSFVKFHKINDDLSTKNKFILFALFFNIFKILAYLLFAFAFVFLYKNEALSVSGVVCGISAVLGGILIFVVYLRS